MKKESSIWGVLAFCAVLILGGMAWLTTHILTMEQERVQAAADAELQGRVRLGLSRIDSVASGVLLIENQRPPHHFRAFYRPGDIFDEELDTIDQGSVVRPSPLATELPEFVKLHFEISEDGSISSPQVPSVDDQQWAKVIDPPADFLSQVGENMRRLKEILREPVAETASETTFSNMDLVCSSAKAPVSDLLPGSQQRSLWLAGQRLENKGNEIALNDQFYQQTLTLQEKGSRASVYQKALEKAVSESEKTTSNRYVKSKARQLEAALPLAKEESAAETELAQNDENRPATISPFNALWVADELFAVRSVEAEGNRRFQGVWFDAAPLRAYLLRTVQEDQLLPLASLKPITQVDEQVNLGEFQWSSWSKAKEDDPLALVTMPWRLLPGEKIAAVMPGWSELQFSLGIVWLAAVFGLLAAAALIRGVMKLSERRASFVSSVTHELRTPLTTFQLYSDMLAEGMVTDEAKKRDYLQTLRKEAGRLNHLIENVLAYSRIERGSAKTRSEQITLKSLVDRLLPRLEQRASDAGVIFRDVLDATDTETQLSTDPAAVEQIVFNLVDNACKYGLPEKGGGEIVFRCESKGKNVYLEVCDQGRGISRSDRSMLFRPFQKSDRDEADTKPGVGLGLSLCRRLARALGGELEDIPQKESGACFRLILPLFDSSRQSA